MLGKHAKAKLVSDFRPIASVRVLYKTFAYMILGRIEQCLEDSQPEEQHGFRGGRRLEEHLVTANLISDKLFAANRPLWIVSLDLSKAFDRINWDALWQSLLEHGVSAHLVWILQLLYCEQTGEVKGTWGNSTIFPIKAGVRQGCVLSFFFCLVLAYFVLYYNGLCRIGVHGPKGTDGGSISMMDIRLYLTFVSLMTF